MVTAVSIYCWKISLCETRKCPTYAHQFNWIETKYQFTDAPTKAGSHTLSSLTFYISHMDNGVVDFF